VRLLGALRNYIREQKLQTAALIVRLQVIYGLHTWRIRTHGFYAQGQYWAGRTPPPNNRPPNMAADNFVVITNGKGCALNRTAFAAVLINQ